METPEGMKLPVRLKVAERPHPLLPGKTVVQQTVDVEGMMFEGMMPAEYIANQVQAPQPQLRAAIPPQSL